MIVYSFISFPRRLVSCVFAFVSITVFFSCAHAEGTLVEPNQNGVWAVYQLPQPWVKKHLGKHFGTTTYVSLNPPHIQDILADQSTCITPPRLVVSTTNNKGEISEGILKCINPCDESVTENEELWGRLTRLRGITIKTRTDGFIEAEAHFHKLKFVPPSDNAVLTFVDPLETPGKTQTWRFSPDFISKQFSKNMSCLESER